MAHSDDNRVKVLLQLQANTVSQLAEIKREEMQWLQAFLIFYGAIVAWGATRWLGSAASNATKNESLVYLVLTISFVATALFTYHFIRTRWSYYGVAGRMAKVERLLGLYSDADWGSDAPLRGSPYSRMVNGAESWEITKPMNSFLTRIVYLIGANVMVASICWHGFESGTQGNCLWYAIAIALVNAAIVFLAFVADYLHFRGPRPLPKQP
jgi:hypothetical protein